MSCLDSVISIFLLEKVTCMFPSQVPVHSTKASFSFAILFVFIWTAGVHFHQLLGILVLKNYS